MPTRATACATAAGSYGLPPKAVDWFAQLPQQHHQPWLGRVSQVMTPCDVVIVVPLVLVVRWYTSKVVTKLPITLGSSALLVKPSYRMGLTTCHERPRIVATPPVIVMVTGRMRQSSPAAALFSRSAA